MKKFDNNDNTEFSYGLIFEFDFDVDDLPGKEYIKQFNEVNLFKEKLAQFVKDPDRTSEPFTGATDEELVEYLAKRCEGIIDKATFKRWFSGSVPNGDERSRENIYKMCFALSFDERTTSEFFLKGYFERPFNCKNVSECFYYFCLKFGRSYEDAQRIIKEVEAQDNQSIASEEENTIAIENAISQIDDEETLDRYLVENNIAAMQQNASGRKEVSELLEKCQELSGNHSIDDLLSEIYGFSARSKDFLEENKSSIKDSLFPKQIKTNFPQRQQLENILKGGGSNDSIRKAIIMLEFFYYFKAAGKNGDPDGFIDELDRILMDCGYVQMYWRNPYDWMIGYSAYSANPLDELQSLIDTFYLSINDTE